MKCANCGAELKLGCVYCSVCGHEAQIVPDYNILEDDYLNHLMNAEEKKEQQREQQHRQTQQRRQKQEKQEAGRRKKRLLILGGCTILAAVIVTAVILIINHNRSNSFDYQYEKGISCAAKKDYAKALDHLTRAASLNPNHTGVLLEMAAIYKIRDDASSLEATLLQILTLDDTEPEAYRMLVALYDKQQKYDAIMDLYGQLKDDSLREIFADYMVPPPVFSVEGGAYNDDVTIELSAPEGCTIYYTLDGTSPVERGKRYREPIELDNAKDYTLSAVCRDERGIYGQIAVEEYSIVYEAPDSATVTPAAGTYTEPTSISIQVPDKCTVYYTWDGSVPTRSSDVYTAPLQMPEGNHVLSILVVDSHDLASPVVRYNYIYLPADTQ